MQRWGMFQHFSVSNTCTLEWGFLFVSLKLWLCERACMHTVVCDYTESNDNSRTLIPNPSGSASGCGCLWCQGRTRRQIWFLKQCGWSQMFKRERCVSTPLPSSTCITFLLLSPPNFVSVCIFPHYLSLISRLVLPPTALLPVYLFRRFSSLHTYASYGGQSPSSLFFQRSELTMTTHLLLQHCSNTRSFSLSL